MNNRKYSTTIFKNGFVVRKPGRRIHFLEASDGFWELCFFKVRSEKLTVYNKAHFDFVRERMGLTYTVKRVIVTAEAMEEIAIGMLGYLRHIENKSLMIP